MNKGWIYTERIIINKYGCLSKHSTSKQFKPFIQGNSERKIKWKVIYRSESIINNQLNVYIVKNWKVSVDNTKAITRGVADFAKF
jgi:hypothetical protein